MSDPIEDIKQLLTQDKEFCRLVPLIDNIAIIEYDAHHVEGSYAVAQYLEENEIDRSCVKNIVLLGIKDTSVNYDCGMLSSIFPCANVCVPQVTWGEYYDVVPSTLVIHMAMASNVTDVDFDNQSAKGVEASWLANKCYAYYASILVRHHANLFDNPYTIRSQFRLEPKNIKRIVQASRTSFCNERQEYMDMCASKLVPKDAFFQCMVEVVHGCEECNQALHYGKSKQCPMAQRVIAGFYRTGMYVPKDLKIAHQWEWMAARQDYISAYLQIGIDQNRGDGCNKDMKKALVNISYYAQETNDTECYRQIVSMIEESDEEKDILAIPYIVHLAYNGDEDMIIKLTEGFMQGHYNLPKDNIQFEQWSERGAESGSLQFIKRTAKLCEDNQDWTRAYQWLKRLKDIAPDLVDTEQIKLVEINMLTSKSTPEEVANKGEEYLYGYSGVKRDLHLAKVCLTYASEHKVPKAMRLLGFMYLSGTGVKKNVLTAVDILHQAADCGDILSIDKLLSLYYVDGIKAINYQDFELILPELIEHGIARKDKEAFYLKGKYLCDGYLYAQDKSRALQYIIESAKLGMPLSQFKLALMYKNGEGVNADCSMYMHWLREAASSGHFEAKGKLGIILFKDCMQKDAKTFALLKESFEQGFTESAMCLANAYYHGFGTPKDLKTSYEIYEVIAKEGNLEACEVLCTAYFHGNGVNKDYNLCAEWGEKAIELGSNSTRFETAYSFAHIGKNERAKEIYTELANEGNRAAMNNLGCLETDAKASARWFEMAAEKGDHVAQCNIGRYYRRGTGVNLDYGKAMEYFTLSASKGDADAMHEIAEMYRCGLGVDKNSAQMVEWYIKAIERDNVNSMLRLADCYRYGEVVDKDLSLAIHYYKLAVEHENVEALYFLGDIFENEKFDDKNISKAVFWYRKAAKKGHGQAKERLKQMNINWLDNDGDMID